MHGDLDTIVALASASGRAGVNIVRLSGAASYTIALKLTTKETLQPRLASFTHFYDPDNHELIDQGLVLYFAAPASFTGEDVIELHCHGSSIISDWLINSCVKLGARLAQAGEFSQRAFTNNKIDLAQAEAIADLIDSSSQQAARAALRSLTGVFSENINQLTTQLTNLRIYIEAAIDFPQEEIDFLQDQQLLDNLSRIKEQLAITLASAKQGSLLKNGIGVAIVGLPNAGKSSLLNYLSGQDTAIVTPQAGTTRDILRTSINLDGLQLNLADTAGLHTTDDLIEQEGMRRAWQEIKKADLVLLVVDCSQAGTTEHHPLIPELTSAKVLEKTIRVNNKADLLELIPKESQDIYCSATTGTGIDQLKRAICQRAGFHTAGQDQISARRRHVVALETALAHIVTAHTQLQAGAGELAAADLTLAQDELGTIVGKLSSDDLLGKIFSDFCIGK
jgi:tRNA modification GTPase